ncbi:MAG: tol-pal system protein YbgF [Syntrophales bacterium]
MKIHAVAVICVCLAVLAGCATSGDLKKLRGEVTQRVGAINERIDAVEKQNNTDHAKISGKIEESLGAVRKNLADSGADFTKIREDLQQLRGDVEKLQKDVANQNRKGDEIKDIRDKLDGISFKVNFLENFLGIGKKESGESDNKGKQHSSAVPASEKEAAYAAAYDLLKDGKYDRARTEFQNFLKKYPDSEYADNAQFWIGESYFSEEKYDKAILEYDKVVKNYSQGNKTSQAQLKQGLAFKLLGDKTSARLLFQQVIKDYPNTNQARTARAYLLELK